MAHSLSKGAIKDVMRGNMPELPITLQLLSFKKVNDKDRYRVILSDGEYSHLYCMLSCGLNSMIVNVEENSIVSISKLVNASNTTNADTTGMIKKIICIVEMTNLTPGEHLSIIGKPKQITYEDLAETSSNEQSVTTPQRLYQSQSQQQPQHQHQPQKQPQPQQQPQPQIILPTFGMNNRGSPQTPDTQRIIPIDALNPYQNRWVIKGRVVAKTNIRTWSNARSEGKLFSFDLQDQSGAIRVTAFNDQCDKFYDQLEMNKVYVISRGTIKAANKKFTTIPHDFELTFTNDSMVQECVQGDNSMPTLQFNIKHQLSSLKDLETGTVVDVVGVVRNAKDLQALTSRAGKELKKREVELVDNSNASIMLTLWGQDAEEFDGSLQPVIALKGARIAEFNGSKSLSMGFGGMVKNPDIPEAHRLRGWFDSLPTNVEFSSISKMGGGNDASNRIWYFKDAEMNQVGQSDKPDYYTVEAYVNFIQPEKCVYKACPTKDCNKKVVDQNNGLYRCEKCNDDFQEFKYRFMLQANIGDWTGSQWVTIFQAQAEELLGVSAQDVGQAVDLGEDISKFTKRCMFVKKYSFRLRSKMENFNGEMKLRSTCVNVVPTNVTEACKRVLKSLQMLAGVEIAQQNGSG